jgi:integrase
MKVNITPHPTKAGWFYLEYRPNGAKGKRHRQPVQGYERATKRKEQIEANHGSTPAPTETHPRLKDVYRDYLKWVEREQAPYTYRNKKSCFDNIIIPHFGKYRIMELTQTVFDEFQEKRPDKKRALILYQAYLGALIKWMVKRKMGKSLDFRPSVPKWHKPKKIIPHPSDLDSVIEAIGHDKREKSPERKRYKSAEPKRVLFKLMLLTGIRWNEARLIEWPNVDIKQGIIRLAESTQEENDLILIPESLLPWFKENRTFSGYVFRNPRSRTGEPYKSLKNCLKNACETAKVKITPHLLRHASATYLYDATGDIYAVQHHLRHKDVKTSQIYTQYSVDRKKKSQQALVVHMDNLKKAAKAQRKRKQSRK